VTPDDLVQLFDDAAAAVGRAVADITAEARRGRTDRAGQYALDLVADAAACDVLRRAPVRIVSEESGVHGRLDAGITVVLDPVDGSTNCARGIAYWATSIAALDADGVLCALVVNQASLARTVATRGGGAFRDGVRLQASDATRIEDSVISIARPPEQPLPWKQYRALACAALSLCDVAAGGFDAHVDTGWSLYPWDYLGGYLACVEAGAVVVDAHGAELVTDDPSVRRRIVAAGTKDLADALVHAIA
jgi:fructose-1,6-bisphosphatase/inositol monophosphatase family enzyme